MYFMPGCLRPAWPTRAPARGFGLPGVGQLLVLRDGDALAVHHPLVAAELRVEAPVDEHAEARLVPPAHALRPRGGDLLKVCRFVHDAFS